MQGLVKVVLSEIKNPSKSPFAKGDFKLPPLKKGSCEKIMRLMAQSGKSPLAPLFQRGEPAVERAEFPNTYPAKRYLPSWLIPPLKKGDKKGDLNFFTASGGPRGIFGQSKLNP
jgi:hypothetical protein